MADERDPDVSRRYRELGAEEPPRALDEAILAASRRAVAARPAPLVAPTGRRRWYFPVAAAAVIMLAVAVTMHLEQQRPDEEIVASTRIPMQKEQQALEAPAAPEPPKAATAPKPQRAPQQFTPEPPAEPLRDLGRSNEQAAAVQGKRASEAPAETRSRSDAVGETVARREAQAIQGAPAPQAAAPAQAKPRPDLAVGAVGSMIHVSPERWLEQIVELRRLGRHEEADKLLAEFRRQYPDYRLSDEMKAKVEKK